MTRTALAFPEPDFATIKSRQNAAWASGDYSVIGTTLQIVGEDLAEALDLRAGQSVLDVAAGNGNFTLAAARRWAAVTSTDYVASLLTRAEERAKAERLTATFELADAEDLPYADTSFDVVASTFGVMFTPDQHKAAAELLRVCRGGGRIGLANWTPTSFVGGMFKTIGRHVPPPSGVKSPALWGTYAHLTELFAGGFEDLQLTEKPFHFRYLSAEHMLRVFRNYYGPVHKAFAALDETAGEALRRDLLDLIGQHNIAADGTVVIPAVYAEIVLTRR